MDALSIVLTKRTAFTLKVKAVLGVKPPETRFLASLTQLYWGQYLTATRWPLSADFKIASQITAFL